MRISEAVDFIAALSRQETDDLSAIEADELMDKMDVSEELRALVVADVVGGQYQCADCFPDGCGEFGEEHAEEHNATGREISLANWGHTPVRGQVLCGRNGTLPMPGINLFLA